MLAPPNHCMQPTPQPVIKFAYANLPPVWWAVQCWLLGVLAVSRYGFEAQLRNFDQEATAVSQYMYGAMAIQHAIVAVEAAP